MMNEERMRKILILLFIVFLNPWANGQEAFLNFETQLEPLFGRLNDNIQDDHKLALNDSVCRIIEKYAASDYAFSRRFDNLKYLGQITSPDSLLKIINWNLVLNDGINRYTCYFVKRNDTGSNLIYKLSGSGIKSAVKTDTTYTQSDWYGALYYDLRPFVTKTGVCYIILGIDYNTQLITRKFIDVLAFQSTGEIIFGRKCFFNGKELKYREVFEYTSKAVMTLRFVSDSSVVFSHLSRFSHGMPDFPGYYGPDQSYDAYNFSNGLWRLDPDIDIRNKEN
jgi:hypothetical protein